MAYGVIIEVASISLIFRSGVYACAKATAKAYSDNLALAFSRTAVSACDNV